MRCGIKLYFLIIVSLFIFTSPSTAEIKVQDKKGHDIQIVIATPDADLRKDKKLFVKTILHAYQDVPLFKINPYFITIRNVTDWLNSAFETEEKLLRQNQNVSNQSKSKFYYVRAFIEKKLIGFLTFNEIESTSYAVDIRQIIIHPDFQKQGIGQQLLSSIIKNNELFPVIKKIFFVTNSLNLNAIHFCKKQGFLESTYPYEGCKGPKCLVFEWNK